MVILGIDPGTAICGYGLVEKKNYQYNLLDYGAINTPPTMTLEERLVRIFKAPDDRGYSGVRGGAGKNGCS